jgi:hypothetical protein
VGKGLASEVVNEEYYIGYVCGDQAFQVLCLFLPYRGQDRRPNCDEAEASRTPILFAYPFHDIAIAWLMRYRVRQDQVRKFRVLVIRISRIFRDGD